MSINASEAARTVHILYNGVDHYDALVEVSDVNGLQVAWEQPPPPAYFNIDTSGTSETFPPTLSHEMRFDRQKRR